MPILMGKSGSLGDEGVGGVEHRLERLSGDDVLRSRVAGRRFFHRAGRVDQDRDGRAKSLFDFRLVGCGRFRIVGADCALPPESEPRPESQATVAMSTAQTASSAATLRQGRKRVGVEFMCGKGSRRSTRESTVRFRTDQGCGKSAGETGPASCCAISSYLPEAAGASRFSSSNQFTTRFSSVTMPAS